MKKVLIKKMLKKFNCSSIAVKYDINTIIFYCDTIDFKIKVLLNNSQVTMIIENDCYNYRDTQFFTYEKFIEYLDSL